MNDETKKEMKEIISSIEVKLSVIEGKSRLGTLSRTRAEGIRKLCKRMNELIEQEV
jgi:hypothetical protein